MSSSASAASTAAEGTEEPSLRPNSARLDTQPAAHTYQAAATGRTDVLDSAGILGLQRAVGTAGDGDRG